MTCVNSNRISTTPLELVVVGDVPKIPLWASRPFRQPFRGPEGSPEGARVAKTELWGSTSTPKLDGTINARVEVDGECARALEPISAAPSTWALSSPTSAGAAR